MYNIINITLYIYNLYYIYIYYIFIFLYINIFILYNTKQLLKNVYQQY